MNTTTNKVLFDERERIEANRESLSDVLSKRQERIAMIAGPCSMQLGQQHRVEAKRLMRTIVSLHGHNMVPISRQPVWKPRTNPADWHGLDETEPETALKLIAHNIRSGVPLGIEVNNRTHIERYGAFLTMMWIGARAQDQEATHKKQLLFSCGVLAPHIPLGVKNALDGSIDSALETVQKIEKLRQDSFDNPAPVQLIFRGGDTCMTRDLWEQRVKEAHEVTEGRLIIDAAHGSEMAHDFSHRKSREGQNSALWHIAQLIRNDVVPTGVMIEASDLVISDLERVTDPNLSIREALFGIEDISTAMDIRRTKPVQQSMLLGLGS